MTNKEYWDGLFKEYEAMSDEEFARLIEEIEQEDEDIFLIASPYVEYVFQDAPKNDNSDIEYSITPSISYDDFSADMHEEELAA